MAFMGNFIEGENRFQATLFPELIDDFVADDSAARVIDVFIDKLDISGLGFKAEAAETGRPGYHPRTMLKLYVYGYINQVCTSRRLEREAGRNVELMWLIHRLAPDHKTISDFRKDNGEAIRLVCREFVMLCRKLDLLTGSLVAIDGSKFKAVNSPDKNMTRTRMKRELEQLEASINRYLEALDTADEESPEDARTIQDKIDALTEEMDRLKKLEVRMHEAPDKQLSLTDPDARSMARRTGGSVVGYNVQAAVDARHHLIVAHEVTNVGHDKYQLENMSLQAREALDTEEITVVADRGYYDSEQIKGCTETGIDVCVPKPRSSKNRAKGFFDRTEFKYEAETDEYRCPAGETLTYRHTIRRSSKPQPQRRYMSSACPDCSLRHKCTTGTYRYMSRWVHEDILEANQARLDAFPEAMKIRRSVAEHPFGTIKSWMGSSHFLTKKIGGVSTEMSLHVLAYDMKRVINIIGAKALLEAI